MSYLATATDLTTTLSSILVEAHKSEGINPQASLKTLDSFLAEAKQINKSIRDLLSYVRAIRTPYLSTAPPPRRNQKHARVPSQIQTPFGPVPTYITDLQREEIDTQTSALVTDLNGTIANLQTATTSRHEMAEQRLQQKYGKSTNFLLRWAAGGNDAQVGNAGKTDERIEEEGREWTTHTVRQEVILYLKEALGRVLRLQVDMLDKRREREREKAASILYDERNKNVKLKQNFEDATGMNADTSYGNLDLKGRDMYNPALDPYSDIGGQDLSPEQLQLFEEENSSLMNHYNETLTQVTQVEKSLFEISSLQQQISHNLTVQSEVIGGLVSDAERTDENVSRGNKELKRATERTSTARIMYHSTLWLCGGLIVWDLIF